MPNQKRSLSIDPYPVRSLLTGPQGLYDERVASPAIGLTHPSCESLTRSGRRRGVFSLREICRDLSCYRLSSLQDCKDSHAAEPRRQVTTRAAHARALASSTIIHNRLPKNG